MALTPESQIIWSDLEAIYTNINTTRTDFTKVAANNATTVTTPHKQGEQIKANDVTALNSFITEMKNYKKPNGTTPLSSILVGVTPPTPSTKATPETLIALSDQAA